MVHQPPGHLTPGVEKAEAQRGQVALPRVTANWCQRQGWKLVLQAPDRNSFQDQPC